MSGISHLKTRVSLVLDSKLVFYEAAISPANDVS